MSEKAVFSSEAKLCETFLAWLPEGWTAYPETGGFDLLLRRDADGAQLGIEAKLSLNSKVISQIVESHSPWYSHTGPDFRAVLIPWGRATALNGITRLLGITVIEQHSKATFEGQPYYMASKLKFRPQLPEIENHHWSAFEEWVEWAPLKRLKLPDYVPDTGAGNPSPVTLTDWKIRAIKLLIVLERRGYVTRKDFAALKMSSTRWLNPYGGWLVRGEEKGHYLRGPDTPALKEQHPRNYAEIEADFDKWDPDKKEDK